MQYKWGVGLMVLTIMGVLLAAQTQVSAKSLHPTTLLIIQCESHGRQEARNSTVKKYPAYGVAQFQYRTFEWLKKKAHHPEWKWTNPQDQIKLLDWAVRHGRGGLWTCYKKVT